MSRPAWAPLPLPLDDAQARPDQTRPEEHAPLPACMRAGASVLVEGLVASRGLLLLDLSANALGDDGAASLAVACSALPQLSHVRLAGNHFGEMTCRLRAQLACVVARVVSCTNALHCMHEPSGGGH